MSSSKQHDPSLVINVPGLAQPLSIMHLVFDFNGTLAEDGNLLPGVAAAIDAFVKNVPEVKLHVVTADTHGTVQTVLGGLPLQLHVIPSAPSAGGQDELKLRFIKSIGPENTVAVGNGRNDVLMLQAAAVGIAVLQSEGCHAAVLQSCDMVVHDVLDVFGLLAEPKRLIATLRN